MLLRWDWDGPVGLCQASPVDPNDCGLIVNYRRDSDKRAERRGEVCNVITLLLSNLFSGYKNIHFIVRIMTVPNDILSHNYYIMEYFNGHLALETDTEEIVLYSTQFYSWKWLGFIFSIIILQLTVMISFLCIKSHWVQHRISFFTYRSLAEFICILGNPELSVTTWEIIIALDWIKIRVPFRYPIKNVKYSELQINDFMVKSYFFHTSCSSNPFPNLKIHKNFVLEKYILEYHHEISKQIMAFFFWIIIHCHIHDIFADGDPS